MKKLLFTFLAAVITLSCMITPVSAHNDGELCYVVDGYINTFEFEDDTLTMAQKRAIVEAILGLSDSSVVPCSSTCTNGHEYVDPIPLTRTMHKVKATNPRCVKTDYLIYTCDNCGYAYAEALRSYSVECCPTESTQ